MASSSDPLNNAQHAPQSTSPHDESSHAVHPSSQLINLLRRRLRDPSIVPAFALVVEGLVRPRWILRAADDDVAVETDGRGSSNGGDDDCVRDAAGFANGTSNNNATDTKGDTATTATTNIEYNTIPKRNYISLRMEQNKLFADDQLLQYTTTIHSDLTSLQTQLHSCNATNGGYVNDWENKWKKQVEIAQSYLEEGLAACPNHGGLLEARKGLRDWLDRVGRRRRGQEASLPMMVNEAKLSSSSLANTQTIKPTLQTTASTTTTTAVPNPFATQKKGAEGRAQAALRDALAERSFMLGDGGGGGGEYPLLPDEDKYDVQSTAEKEGEVHCSDSSSKSHRRHRRKHRKERKHRKSKRDKKYHHRDGRKRKRMHRDDNRTSRRRRSRSASSSTRSTSRSISRERRSVSQSENRSYQRRKDKKYKRHRRRRSRDDHDDDGGGGENSDEGGKVLEGIPRGDDRGEC
jgi:hypothetical protein